MKLVIAFGLFFAVASLPVSAQPKLLFPNSQKVMHHSTPTSTSLPFLTLSTSASLPQIQAFYRTQFPEFIEVESNAHRWHLAQKKADKLSINAYANIPNIRVTYTPAHNNKPAHHLIQIFYQQNVKS